MPTLLEIERAVYRSLVEGDDSAVALYVLADGLAPEARLNVYRNTVIGALTAALRLSFPAIHSLVGAAFFESAARLFIEAQPPRSAWLDEYGDGFAEFLEGFEPAASIPYLPGVARLEWAVSRALHAPDADPLDIARLSAIDLRARGRVAFTPHPSLALIHADHPVDDIWRAVLARDDAAMAAADPGAGPVWLLVQRLGADVEVARLSAPEWRLTVALCAGRPLQEAIDSAPNSDAATVLAAHLSAGHFVGFELIDPTDAARRKEVRA